MSLVPDHEFAVEIHPRDWHFPAEPCWVAGWIRPKSTRVVTDIRARIGHRIMLGLGGLPHPAVATPPGIPGPGFSFLLNPHPEATLLQLEARDPSGEWFEFFCVRISVAPTAPPVPQRPYLSQSLRRQVIALIRHRMLSPQRAWSWLADDLLASLVAEPLNAHPNPPFIGALEEPHDTGRFRYGVVPVTGWLAHAQGTITRLTAVIDPLPPTDLPYGPARQDIARTFSTLERQPSFVFAGEIALPDDCAEPVLLKIFAELDNGEKHLAFARRFTLQFHRGPGEMPPQISGFTFACAIRALYHAAGRYALSRHGLIQAAYSCWSTHQARTGYRPARRFRAKWWSRFPNGAIRPADMARTSGPDLAPATTVIAQADDMLVRDHTQYLKIGREALTLVQDACALAGCERVEAVLDLPCGHGRVARWLRAAYPKAKLVVSDTQGPGVSFCMDHLGATGAQAMPDGSHWNALPGPYDIIWCGSLLTHFDRDQWLVHLRRFAERLSPGGVLVLTTHGSVALDKLQTGEKDYGLPPEDITRLCDDAVAQGFGYVGYRETPAYGISISQPPWIRELLERETDLRVLSIWESAWDQHQDVVVCRRRSL